jgi:hypothetical protein
LPIVNVALPSINVNLSIELGRIAGIKTGINWSWLVVFALIVWSLAAGVFPSQNPGPSDGMAQFKGSFPNPGAERRGPTNAQT